MIEFSCTYCGRKIRVADKHAGKRGTCQQCGKMLQIPDSPSEREIVDTESCYRIQKPLPIEKSAPPVAAHPEDAVEKPRVSHFETYIAGTAHKNSDGTSRQRAISRLAIKDQLHLSHEPENPHDENAIRVFCRNGRTIGYIPRRFAKRLVAGHRAGCKYVVLVTDVITQSGGKERNYRDTHNVDVVIIEGRAGVPEDEVQRYFDRFVQPLFS